MATLDKKQSRLSSQFPKDSYLGKQENVNHLIEWATFYKRNLHRFVEHYLGLEMHLYQVIILYLMNLFPTICLIASRAAAKSYLIAIFACCKAILYPHSQIVIASGTKGQSKLIVSEKIKKELLRDSPILRKEISTIKDSNNDVEVIFKNGSSIVVVPATDNARGHRANIIIYEEFRMIKKEIIDSVLSPFLIVRPAPYLKCEEYTHLSEEPIEVWISSSWFQSHWMWNLINVIKNDSLKNNTSCILAMDYSITLKHNLRTRKQLIKERKKLDPISWAIEYENQMISENMHAYFSFDILNVNQKLKKAFYPRKNIDYISNKKNKFSIPRIAGEKRIIACDIAMIENDHNDNSVFTCIRLLPETLESHLEGKGSVIEQGYKRQVPYIEALQGGETSKQAVRIKQLFEDFDADFCVLDKGNAGISIYDSLAKILYDEERDKEYRPWTCMNDDDVGNRIRIENSLPVIFVINGSAKLNSMIAGTMREVLSNKRIELLINQNEAVEEIQRRVTNYYDLPAEDQFFFEYPYLETTFLINELLSLEYEVLENSGYVRLREASGNRKDRYSSLSYGNYFASLLEQDLFKKTKKADFSKVQYCVSAVSF